MINQWERILGIKMEQAHNEANAGGFSNADVMNVFLVIFPPFEPLLQANSTSVPKYKYDLFYLLVR